MQLLNSYSADRFGLRKFLKSIDAKSIRKHIFLKYEHDLQNMAYKFSEQIGDFDVDSYLDTLTIEDIYLILGLNLKDYLYAISVYSSDIIISDIVDGKFNTYDIID